MCKPKLGLDGVDTPYLDFRMPTRALMLLRMLKLGPKVKTGSVSRLRRRVCGYAEFKAAAKKLGLDHSDEVVEHLLRILSGLGAVSWFPEATSEGRVGRRGSEGRVGRRGSECTSNSTALNCC